MANRSGIPVGIDRSGEARVRGAGGASKGSMRGHAHVIGGSPMSREAVMNDDGHGNRAVEDPVEDSRLLDVLLGAEDALADAASLDLAVRLRTNRSSRWVEAGALLREAFESHIELTGRASEAELDPDQRIAFLAIAAALQQIGRRQA